MQFFVRDVAPYQECLSENGSSRKGEFVMGGYQEKCARKFCE